MSLGALGGTTAATLGRSSNAAARDASATTSNSPTNTNAYAELDSGEFVKLLLTELTNQDPFKPTDSQAIMEQLSSLRSMESDLALQDKLEALALSNNLTSAGALIGKNITGLDGTNSEISGTVESVRIVDGRAELSLGNGRTVKLERVTQITDDPYAAPRVPTPGA